MVYEGLPETVQGTWLTILPLHHTTSPWCHPILPASSEKSRHSSHATSETGAGTDGEAGGDCEADRLVSRNGSRPKTKQESQDMRNLTRLNESVRRERHPLPSVDQVLAQLSGATIFSKLDANSGFWQVPLSQESALLITPFGRFCFHRLPFGISSAPEIFQRMMSQMQSGLHTRDCLHDG